MITKFKLFENLNTPPKVGDYVLIDSSPVSILHDFLENNIGKIVRMNKNPDWYVVVFDKNPTDDKFHKEYDIQINSVTDFKIWSDNKEELETIIQANKYNL